jgi:hypothetical protein
MKKRTFWLGLIEREWVRKTVLWLSGVRQVGKTTLCRSLEEVEYFDCELPSVRREIADPESFLRRFGGRRIILDEIHRLDDPAEVLKLAADHFPEVRVLATGSSTLGASSRFRDTLAGRKSEVWLTPMIVQDGIDFGETDPSRRFLHGGLPAHFLASEVPERDFLEWLDAFWAKDILSLFRLEQKHAFQKFVEMILARSGGIFEATGFARPCEVSRSTIANYLAVLEATYVAHVIRPFHSRKAAEIISAPRVYGFDTGFICLARGWFELRPEDRGSLWEHVVLNELQARFQTRDIHYWRDKQGHEVDFVLVRRKGPPAAVECKWSADAFEAAGLRSFRIRYPAGPNYVVAADVARPFEREYRGLNVEFVGLDDLVTRLSQDRPERIKERA